MLNAGPIGAEVGFVLANVALAAGLGGLLGHQIKGTGV